MKGKTETVVLNKLTTVFNNDHIELINESHQHAGPASDSHFKLIITSNRFSELSPVKRHQWVYKLLTEELAGPIHGLALHLHTNSEWEKLLFSAKKSPKCAGKN